MFEQIRLFMYAVMVIAMELKRYNDARAAELAATAEAVNLLRKSNEQQERLLQELNARTTVPYDPVKKH